MLSDSSSDENSPGSDEPDITPYRPTCTSSSLKKRCLAIGQKRDKANASFDPRAQSEILRAKPDKPRDSTVLSTLQDISHTLNKVVKRLEKTESRLSSMEEKIADSHTLRVNPEDHIVKSHSL